MDSPLWPAQSHKGEFGPSRGVRWFRSEVGVAGGSAPAGWVTSLMCFLTLLVCQPDSSPQARVMGHPCVPATIQLTETMWYIGQVKVEDRKGYPMCIADIQADEPSAYSLCTGY